MKILKVGHLCKLIIGIIISAMIIDNGLASQRTSNTAIENGEGHHRRSWRVDHLNDTLLTRQEWKQIKKEKRKERKEMRRKNKLIKNIAASVDADDDSDVLHHKLGTQSFGFKHHNEFGFKKHAERRENLRWIKSNVSSIWNVLNTMQAEILELKSINEMNKERKQTDQVDNQKDRRHRISESNKKIIFQQTVDICPESGSMAMRNCEDEYGVVCSKRGRCGCGGCECDSPSYGPLCSCSDLNCDRYNGMLCSGSANGDCRCNKCFCRRSFMGEACECSTLTDKCKKSPDDKFHCSRNGVCKCNECHCSEGHSGHLCEENIYSANICGNLKACVLCLKFGKKLPSCKECNVRIREVEALEPNTKRCVMVNSGCLLEYGYEMPTQRTSYTITSQNPEKQDKRPFHIFVTRESSKCGSG